MFHQVFACLDVQGFYVNNDFYPREFAIVNECKSGAQNIDTRLNIKDMCYEDQLTCRFLTNNFHGLTLRPKDPTDCLNIYEAMQCILKYQQETATEKKPYYGIKNDMLKRILHEFGIPHLCLESIGCPSHKILEQSFNQKLECDWHKNKNLNGCKQYICALRKCNNLWKWIEENSWI